MKISFTKTRYDSGMTLVELLVVLAIFVLITGTILFNYGGFRSSVSAQNLVDDIALSIRRAQSYAIGAHVANNTFTNGYGVHFSMATPSSTGSAGVRGSNKSFVMFTDIPSGGSTTGDKVYNSTASSCGVAGDECTEILNITTSDFIRGVYLNDDGTPIPTTGSVDIVFRRPNPDAYFCYKATDSASSTCDSVSGGLSHVRIEVASSLNTAAGAPIKTVTVWNTGQISVSSSVIAGPCVPTRHNICDFGDVLGH